MANTRYHVSQNQFNDLKCRLVYITTAKYEDDWHSTAHFHHFTELFYIVRGKGSFLVENSIFEVKEDDLVIVNPNVSHTELSKDNEPMEYIALGIEGLLFSDFTEDTSVDYFKYNYEEFKHEILFYLKTLVQEAQRKEEHYDVLCQNLLEVLIINVIRRTNNSITITSTKKMNKECSYIKQYIDMHYKENITLEELANLTFMNKYYLVHAFKKYMGISPINYVIQKRVEEATELLLSTSYSVSQVSQIIGFSSQSYFSQIYKKMTGKTPFEVRKKRKEDERQEIV